MVALSERRVRRGCLVSELSADSSGVERGEGVCGVQSLLESQLDKVLDMRRESEECGEGWTLVFVV